MNKKCTLSDLFYVKKKDSFRFRQNFLKCPKYSFKYLYKQS